MSKSLKTGFIFAFALIFSVTAQIFSPGALSKGHNELNGYTNCVKCHSGNRDRACLSCHVEIQKKVTDNKGFHAKQQNKLKKSCVSCHSEHKGVEYDLSGLDRNPFDHKDTSWPLMGKHEKVKCDKCHTQKRSDVAKTTSRNPSYLLAKSTCISCHPKEDVHLGIFGAQCESCHIPFGWKNILSSKPSENPSAASQSSTPVTPTAVPTAIPTAPPIP